MDKFDRLQMLHRILKRRKHAVSAIELSEHLECSTKTVKRSIDQMRDYLNAPIVYDSIKRGYCYSGDLADMFELPGIWLTAEELRSLTSLLELLNTMGNGLLKEELGSVKKQISKLLAARGVSVDEFEHRIKFLPLANRSLDNHIFTLVSESLLSSLQLSIHYRSYNHQSSCRIVSPQTLIYYRENWYLDAWCHLRQDLRTFSIARIEKAEVLKKISKKLDVKLCQEHYAKGFGIFSGHRIHQARLRFFPSIAREIANQEWHPNQQGKWDNHDYLLNFPYSDDRELIQDILRYIPHVVVEGPAKLREAVRDRIHAGLIVFSGNAKKRV